MSTFALDPVALGVVLQSVARCAAAKGVQLDSVAHDPLALISRAAVHLGEDLGLQVAADIPIGVFGTASYGVATAPRLRDALAIGLAHTERMMPGFTARLRVRGQRAELEVRFPDDTFGPFIEEFILAILERYDALLANPTPLRAVTLRRRAPLDPGPWSRLFGVLPTFGAPATTSTFDAAALDGELRTACDDVHRFVTASIPATTTARIRAYVKAHLRASSTEIAKELGITHRTLQRRLLAEGTSLRAIVSAARIEAARDLLLNTRYPIARIAQLVGFARVTSFTRAFKSATNVSASEYRSNGR